MESLITLTKDDQLSCLLTRSPPIFRFPTSPSPKSSLKSFFPLPSFSPCKKRKYLDLLINLSLSLSLFPSPSIHFETRNSGKEEYFGRKLKLVELNRRESREKKRERVRKRGVEKNQRRVFPIPGIVNELEAGGENRARMNGEWRRRFHE